MRLQVIGYEAANPATRDRWQNTLYFRDNAVIAPDADALCTDLAAIYAAAHNFGHANRIQVKAYDIGTPAPRVPIGEHTTERGLETGGPREVALCLSFYSDVNQPRRRGRIYVGPWSGALGTRPTDAAMNEVLALSGSFAGLGGANIDWCVYSPTSSVGGGGPVFHKISTAWVDDEWDVQRRRGLRGTKRFSSDVSG